MTVRRWGRSSPRLNAIRRRGDRAGAIHIGAGPVTAYGFEAHHADPERGYYLAGQGNFRGVEQQSGRQVRLG
ncbi:MAG: hypothetical protein MZV70_77585 [Desulfobacterales bacterium]|nr:hypothetical protein [Desulfobacterales bacterium]